jgi:hypothetical protein
MPRDFLDVTVRGLDPVLRALDALPRNADREVRAGAVRLSRTWANAVRAAGRASDRQSAVASRSVRTQTRGNTPAIVAGPHPLLLGSEFGVRARFGWYRKARYWHSEPRQFRARRPTGYWFFPTQQREQPAIRRAHQDMVDAIVHDWSAP